MNILKSRELLRWSTFVPLPFFALHIILILTGFYFKNGGIPIYLGIPYIIVIAMIVYSVIRNISHILRNIEFDETERIVWIFMDVVFNIGINVVYWALYGHKGGKILAEPKVKSSPKSKPSDADDDLGSNSSKNKNSKSRKDKKKRKR
jgi:hypothetical protein